MKQKQDNRNAVMLNAYPDSIGKNMSDLISIIKRPEFKDAFSFFYVLPTFFNSDLDRGFSIIDYNINEDLVSESDLEELKSIDIQLKFDIVLNHLSVGSPQFQDLLKYGDDSKYINFFIDWNKFWEGNGELNEEGIIIPEKEYLDRLFMRKAGLPILKVPFPDGTLRPYWNTFYQKIEFEEITIDELEPFVDSRADAEDLAKKLKCLREPGTLWDSAIPEDVKSLIRSRTKLLGQMDVNAESRDVWIFYEDVIQKVSQYGGKILRLDAFAYLHKSVGESNFFNEPGTWQYLERIRELADKFQLTLLPEIHAEYGVGLHKQVADHGYMIYDFFLPGLIIHTLETASYEALFKWANEIITESYQTINMLGCHDGIPVLDLKGKNINGTYHPGLLSDEEIDNLMKIILDRGGRVKNLYGPNGEEISYYQINSTYYSALGSNDEKMLLARALQIFMPGIPQVWYLDLFQGENDYDAADRAGEGGHKEINRTNLNISDIEVALKNEFVLKQIDLLRIRNSHRGFDGNVTFTSVNESKFTIEWRYKSDFIQLTADLLSVEFSIDYSENGAQFHKEF